MGRSEPVDLRTARTRGGGRSDAARARRRGEGSTGLLPPRRRKLSSNDGTPPHLLDRLVRSSAGRRRGAVERLEAHSSTARAAASRGFRSLVDASWRLRTQGGRRAVMHLERRLGTQARWSGTLSGGPGRAEAARRLPQVLEKASNRNRSSPVWRWLPASVGWLLASVAASLLASLTGPGSFSHLGPAAEPSERCSAEEDAGL